MGRDLKDIKPERVEGTPQLCLKTLLRFVHYIYIHKNFSFLQTLLEEMINELVKGTAL